VSYFEYNPFTGKFDIAPPPGGATSPSGPSSYLASTKTAQATIVAGDPVYFTSITTVAPARANTTLDHALVGGVAMNDAAPGSQVIVATWGEIFDSLFSIFPVNALLFLDAVGGITDIRLATGFHVPLGISLGGGGILLNINKPTKLS
jgi:hypothetical protein